MKRASELATTRKRSQARQNSNRRRRVSAMAAAGAKQRHALSTLETLPSELVEQIFWHALEINMARASPVLARTLSKERIYQVLLLFAFFEDYNCPFVSHPSQVYPLDEQYFQPAQYRCWTVEERARLQAIMLDCRWCSFDRIKRALPALAHLSMAQEWYTEHRLIQLTHHKVLEVEKTTSAWLPELHDRYRLERHFRAKAASDADSEAVWRNAQYRQVIDLWNLVGVGNGDVKKIRYRSLPIMDVLSLPRRSITGAPWTPEKVEFLMFLRRGLRQGARSFRPNVGWNDILSYVALFEGMASAITEANLEALKVLLEIHSWAFLGYKDDTYKHIWRRGPRKIHLPVTLFHLACKQGSASGALLRSLVREDSVAIPKDDPVITRWADAGAVRGDNFASWLSRYMDRTDNWGSSGQPVFIGGANNLFPGIQSWDVPSDRHLEV